MAQPTKEPQQNLGQTQTLPFLQANKQRQQTEERAVAGRLKNKGQKGHKGAR